MTYTPEIEEIASHFLAFVPVGSRVTCDPPPEDSDIDYLAYVPNKNRAGDELKARGFVTTTSDTYKGLTNDFVSFKKGLVNIIVTQDADFYDAFLVASHVAKRLNLLRKSDRIALFQAVLYRNRYND